MGTAVQHRQKAEHNLEFLKTIGDDYPDWMATVAFYAAVEMLEALFAERGYHSTSHEDRKRYVRKNFQSIYQAYSALYNASLDGRYQPSNRWLPAAEVRSELIARRLKHIKSFCESHAKDAAA